MTNASMDVEHIARAFPSPKDSRPARSLTYRCRGRVYRAVIGQPRRQCDDAASPAGPGKPAGRAGWPAATRWSASLPRVRPSKSGPGSRRATGRTLPWSPMTRSSILIISKARTPSGAWPGDPRRLRMTPVLQRPGAKPVTALASRRRPLCGRGCPARARMPSGFRGGTGPHPCARRRRPAGG
jgi:hypothetical protein